jgi:putative ABC transport system ATP-binding protein
MIKTIDLIKIFRTEEVETTALNKVNLSVEKGEIHPAKHHRTA